MHKTYCQKSSEISFSESEGQVGEVKSFWSSGSRSSSRHYCWRLRIITACLLQLHIIQYL